jgi:cytoskeleton protein RodZ
MSERSMQHHENASQQGAWQAPWLLTQAREAAGLHLAALAAALKVPVEKLEALEAGRYEELPDLTFARALASSACRHMRLDPAPVLDQMPPPGLSRLGESGQSINAPFKPLPSASAAHPVGWLSRPAVLGAAVLVLGALALVFLPEMGIDRFLASRSASAGGTTVAETVTSPATPSSEPGTVTAVIAEPSLAPASPTVALSGASTAPEPERASPALMQIRATADSWVQVLDATSTVHVQRVLRTGEVVDVAGTPPYAVVLGRVEAAEITVRGQPFDATPFARNSVARFEVK